METEALCVSLCFVTCMFGRTRSPWLQQFGHYRKRTGGIVLSMFLTDTGGVVLSERVSRSCLSAFVQSVSRDKNVVDTFELGKHHQQFASWLVLSYLV
jgi:hypothetical protein